LKTFLVCGIRRIAKTKRNDMLSLRTILPIIVCMSALSGCAQNVWNKTGATQQDFATDQYACERDARQSGGFGTGFAGAIEVQGYFNRCMGAHGWTLENKEQAQAQANSRMATTQSLVQQRRECIAHIREESKYQIFATHFSDLKTGKYTFTQMSDPQTPSPVQATLLRDYFTDAAPCQDSFLNTFLPMLPSSQADILRANRNEADVLDAQLVKRELSWGDYSTRVNERITDNEAKLHNLH
jgi:hypothetical protein